MIKRPFHLILSLLIALGQFTLPAAAQLRPVSVSTSVYQPANIQGLTVFADEPFKFDFLISPGTDASSPDELKAHSDKLIKYFFTALTVPEDNLWVNLSPYEEDRIIPDALDRTEMGRVMLEQDYTLKQLSASLLNPDDPHGSAFWNRVYRKAEERFGTTDVPMNTFNKIWIVPESAEIYEHGTTAVITDSRMKVLLDNDYLALEMNRDSAQHGLGNVNDADLHEISDMSRAVLKEIIIPEIEREVNEGAAFAELRQVSNAVILASWYKRKVKNALMENIYVNRAKTAGVGSSVERAADDVFNRYVAAFEEGVFEFIHEEYDADLQEVVTKKYFSGGENLSEWGAMTTSSTGDFAQLSAARLLEGSYRASVEAASIAAEPDAAMIQQNTSEPVTAGTEWNEVVFDQVTDENAFAQMHPDDRRIVAEILSGDDQRLRELIGDNWGKVQINHADNTAVGQGRTVYINLETPVQTQYGTIEVLRLKDVRPGNQRARSGGLSPHIGIGWEARRTSVDENGNISLTGSSIDMRGMQMMPAEDIEALLDERPELLETLTPQGMDYWEKAKREFEAMQAGVSGDGFRTDIPLALGTWKNLTYRNRRLGFVIAGMRQRDVRLFIPQLVDTGYMARDIVNTEPLLTNPQQARTIFRKLGNAVRAFHDNGNMHQSMRYLNIGIEEASDGDFDIVLRDLNAVLNRSELSGDAARQEASYRLVDIRRALGDLSVVGSAFQRQGEETVKNRITPLVESFIEGYFPELSTESAEFQALLTDMTTSAFAALPRTLYELEGAPMEFSAETPVFGRLWNRLYEAAGEYHGDNAMLRSDNVGGIDLNPQNLDIRSSGELIEIQIDPSRIQLPSKPITGLQPVIINFAPVTNIPLLIGSGSDRQDPLTLSRLD